MESGPSLECLGRADTEDEESDTEGVFEWADVVIDIIAGPL